MNSKSQNSLIYRALRSFTRFWVNRFFRNIEVNGIDHVPDGAVIFAMNHPNNLIDSLLVGYAIDRKINYLATAQMFRNKIVAMFLYNAGVIPVYRKQDDPSHGHKNEAMFQACYEVLKNGGAIGIYPEGTTHAEPRIRKIKTGAARIALEAEYLYHNHIKIVPVGLNFSVRKSFREEVIINIGKPIDASDYLQHYEHDNIAAVDQLTSDLQDKMEEQVVHIDEPNLDLLVKDIEEIYKGELIRDMVEVGIPSEDVDEFQISKKLIDGIHFFNRTDPARVRNVQTLVRSYRSRLKKTRLQDETLENMTTDRRSYRSFVVRMMLFIVGLLPALWGGVNHILPYEISRRISHKIAKKETDYATARILSGIILYPLFYGLQIYWVWKHYNFLAAAVYGGTLPMFGAFAFYYWDKVQQLWDEIQLFFMMITRRRLLENLKNQRERLIAIIDEAKDDYLKHANV